MAKHLAKTETKVKKPWEQKVIRIPERKGRKHAAPLNKDIEDKFQSAMLNKTLDRKFSLTDLVLTVLSLVLLVVVYFLPTHGLVRLLSFLLPFLLAGFSYLFEAFQEAFMGIVLGRELIVTVASLLAFCGGSNFGGAAIMVFLKLIDLMLSFAESLQNEKVSALYALRPDKASRVDENGLHEVKCSDLQEGDILEIQSGEIVPVDGMVVEGTSSLDTSALSGSSASYAVAPGSAAVSGSTNSGASIRIRVLRTSQESVNSAMIRGAENSWMHKSSQEQLVQRILSYASPALVILSLVLALVLSIATGDWRSWFVRAAILLTVSQMYSVVQSIKLSYDCAAACGAAKGILYKGHDVLEAFSKAETFVFDKTGTITEGQYRIKEVFPRGVTEEQLLFLAGAAELRSKHPIAKAIVAASGAYASDISVVDIRETPGRGVCAFIDGRNVYVGNAALMDDHGIAYATPSVTGSAIHVAVDNHYIGHIIVEDAIRDGAFDAIEELRIAGASTNILLTGDVHSSARKIASSLNFDMVKAELTPEEKCNSVSYLMGNRNVNTTLAFVGDGICDTEALRRATVGVAFSCLDKKEAVDAADIAIMGGDIHQLSKAYRMAKRASQSAAENAIVCGAVKLIVLILGAAGVFSVGLSVLLQTGAVAFETMNALRALYFEDQQFVIRKEKKRK